MVNCGPVCAVPSCASTPTVGFGSTGLRGYGNLGYSGLGFGGLGYGFGALAESANNVGILAGVRPTHINQLRPSEINIDPPPIFLTIPGVIFSSTREPTLLGGITPCAVGGYGPGRGLGFGNYEFGFGNSSGRGKGTSQTGE